MAFLKGLNDSYGSVRSQILLMEPLPSISKVFSLIAQEESQRQVTASSAPLSDPQLAFVVQGNSKPGPDKGNPKGKKDRPTCSHCGILGHTRDRCYKIHGYPPNYKKQNNNQISVNMVESKPAETSSLQLTNAQYHQLMALLSSQVSHAVQPVSNSTSTNDNIGGIVLSAGSLHSFSAGSCWILDSGASSHITSSLSVFTSYRKLHDSFVTLPEKSRIPVLAIGTVTFAPDFLLHNVLYVPSFHVNLISVSALLCNTNFSIHFTDHSFSIQDHRLSKVIGKGDLINGLYVYKLSPSQLQDTVPIHSDVPVSSHVNSNSSFSCNVQYNEVSADVWHHRLGHVFDTVF